MKTKAGVSLYDDGAVTLSVILSNELRHVYEDEDYWYIEHLSTDMYENIYWVIDKKTKSIHWAYGLDLMCADFFDKATEIDPEELKKTLL